MLAVDDMEYIVPFYYGFNLYMGFPKYIFLRSLKNPLHADNGALKMYIILAPLTRPISIFHGSELKSWTAQSIQLRWVRSG